jgi:hypothetical protein
MLNPTKKTLVAVVLLLCISGSGLTAYGMFWVTSNIEHVDMQYSVELSISGSNRAVSLTARVRHNGNPVRAGISVDFYYSFNGGDWIYFANGATNRGGVARATYRVNANGAYDFKAIASST